VVEHPLSERVAWRSVWRLLLALSALLLAAWSVGASDRNPWVPAPAATVAALGPTLPLKGAASGLSLDSRAITSRPALWAPAVAGSALPASVETGAAVTGREPGGRSPQALPLERSDSRAAEFDGLSIILAVLALLALVSWRRRDQVLR
jgi:hypothetical protein